MCGMIGEKIREIRKSKNLTIVQLSEMINVTSGYISQIERDLISPSLSVLKRLSQALDVPLSVLFLDKSDTDVVTIPQNERTKVKLIKMLMKNYRTGAFYCLMAILLLVQLFSCHQNKNS